MSTPGITEEEIRNVFNIFDADGSGYVEVEELGFALEALGLGVLEKRTIDTLVAKTCPEGSVQVDLDEFSRMVKSCVPDRNSVDEAARNFALLLRGSTPSGELPEGKYHLDVEDLLHAARQIGELREGDAQGEQRWRRIFTDATAALSSSDRNDTDRRIHLSNWVSMMLESVSDKRHRVRDTSSYSIKTRAKIAKRGPYGTRVEEGKTYFFCTCGMSKNQPFCDGSHNTFNLEQGVHFQPLVYTADETKTVWFCGCKRSSILPLCDGTHSTLPPQ